jgi:hypothetical protein
MASGGPRNNSGGARPGAGRKKGVLDKKTQNLQRIVAAGGSTPLDDMVEAYRWFREEAHKELRKGAKADRALVMELFIEGAHIASKAAPYVHQRLAALEITQLPVDISRLSDAQLAQLERLMAAAAPVPPVGSSGDPETHHSRSTVSRSTSSPTTCCRRSPTRTTM